MYREKDINKINLIIDKIKDNAEMIYQKNIEPTMDEQNDIYNNILDYIIKKKKNNIWWICTKFIN